MAAEENAEAGEPTPAEYVYLIHHPESGAYKIGRSVNPSQRLVQLAPQSAGLVLVETIPTPDAVWLERALHLSFAHRRVKGEWFALSDDDVAVIRRIGTADGPEDLTNEVHSLYDDNEERGFVWGCVGHPSNERLPIPAPLTKFRLSPAAEIRLAKWMALQRVPPTLNAVLLQAFDEFLDREGIPKLEDEPE